MKRILAVMILAACSLVLLSCGEANVAPKKTDAAPSNTATTTAPASNATAEADIKKLLKDIETALGKNDADALDKLYAPDYTVTHPDGTTQTRAERLGSIKSGDTKYESFSYSDVTVTPYGDAAVVHSVATIKGLNKGKPIDGKLRVMSFWVKGRDGWRQVSAQATTIAEPAKTDAKTDDAKKDDMKKADEKMEADKK